MIHNFIYTASYQLLVLMVPLITTPYISRVLGAEKIGIYSFSYSIAHYFVLFIMLGLNNYGSRTIAMSKDDVHLKSRNFINIYALQFLLGISLSCLYILYCFYVSQNSTISVLLFFYVLSGVLDVTWYFNGMELFKFTVIRNTLIKVLSTVAIFVFVKDSDDLALYTMILSISFFLSQIALWPVLIKQIYWTCPTWHSIARHIMPNARLFLTVIAISLYKIMDKIMLGVMSDYTQVGYYEASEKIIAIPIMFITALGTVMLPHASHVVAKNNSHNGDTLNVSILFAMLVSSVLCFGIMGVSDIFVPIFYGSGFELCTYLFLVLLPSCLFLAFANVIRTQFLLPKQMDRVYIFSTFLGAGINLTLNTILIPHFAAIGTAIATFFAEMSVCSYQCYKCRKSLPIKTYIQQICPMCVAGLCMFILLYCISVPISNTILALCAEILIGAIFYLCILVIGIYISRRHYENIFEIIKNKLQLEGKQ